MESFKLDEVIKLAREAGEVALKYFGGSGARRKPDNTYVTEADCEVERLVRSRLAEITPGFGVLGEEEGLTGDAGEGAPCWVVDPVDGTSSFVSGLPCWSFSLGLVESDKASFGLVYLPVIDEMYYTGPDGSVFFNGEPCEPQPPAVLDSEAVLYVPSDFHRCYEITFPGKLRSLGSAAYHGIMTARPLTAGVLQGRIYLWDAAAILAINAAWGMRIGTLSGKDVTPSLWNVDQKINEPIFFAHPQNFEKIAAMVKRIQH